MESSKRDKALEASKQSIQVDLDVYGKSLGDWDFLLEHSAIELAQVAMSLCESRIANDNQSCMDPIAYHWTKCKHSRPVTRARVMSMACLEQAALELERGEYAQSIVMSVYSEMYNTSGDAEWVWQIMPISYDTMIKQRMLDHMNYIKELLDHGKE